jgi:peptide/nickel transport system substrate-binding protein
VDRLLEQGRMSCVQAERTRYYHRLQEVLAEDQPIVFLYFRDALPVVSSRVKGIVPSPNGIRYNFHEWFVPKHLQRYTAG